MKCSESEGVMKFIAVTGGIGSGKTTVAVWLSKETALSYINSDHIAKDIFSQDSVALKKLKNIISSKFFLEDGGLDRSALRKAIFEDSNLRWKVNEFSHPLIWERVKKRASKVSSLGAETVIVEVPLLFEAGWDKYFDEIIVVYADPECCLRRLMQRDSLSEEDAFLAISAQKSLVEKALLADHVINNSGEWLDTLLQIKHVGSILKGKNT